MDPASLEDPLVTSSVPEEPSAGREATPSPRPVSVATLRHVTVRYGATVALSDVTACFAPGLTGLLGVNGAGKSTLMLALLGLVAPAEGHIDVLGLDPAVSARAVRARVALVPDRDAAFPEMNAVSSVAYAGELSGLPAADAISRAHDVLSYVGLHEVRYRAVETFSTGVKQRLKLAHALAGDPDLLLLDEPTDGLDPAGRESMLGLIRDLGRRYGLSVILSSHLLQDIERTCDTCVILHQGRVRAAGPMWAWRAGRPGTVEVRVRGDAGAFTRALRAARFSCEPPDEHGAIAVVVPAGGVREIFVLAHSLGMPVRELRPRLESLDEFFARVTSETGAAQGDTPAADPA